ncbi:bifunctional phosphopantothenoylcysteine decarboxylase/phosphopantothenate--cysteine ligase CoaBC [Candidatus Gottesmanbacteria bacterium]|nr:bifunctional phosphopantothenoylcysteine decarboxylase/phosphopantothenate--cysteine ligase CoaBC [Candidatus Gottesmanbacteria bacterium]
MKKVVLLGVTGGIAAYKSLQIVTLLKKKNIDVFIIPTKSALEIVPLREFENVSRNKVYFRLFEDNFDYKEVLKEKKVEHINLADKADIFVIAPATANIIAKIAHGIADDYLTTTLLASACTVIICPSMNVNMWRNPAVVENITILKRRGYYIVGPDPGPLACGYEGQGRLREPSKIVEEILIHLYKTDILRGKKIVVTSGGTVEKIDEVRVIANRSSGKMGAALAETCYLYGANVLLLRAKSALKPRYLINEETFITAEDLSKLLEKHVKNASALFHAAAVSDFKVTSFEGKVSSEKSITLVLQPRKKIINKIKKINPDILLVGFKAEYKLSKKDLTKKVSSKFKESNADVIIANDIAQQDGGFGSDYNEMYIFFRNGKTHKINHAPKAEIAKRILDILLQNKFLN